MASWRRLGFFSETQEVDPSGILERSTAVCPFDDGLVVGDAEGTCHVLGRTLQVRTTFPAHNGGVAQLVQPRGSSLVFSFGRELEGGIGKAYMRVWRVSPGGEPAATCVRHLRVFGTYAGPTSSSGTPATASDPAITCCCVSDDLSQVAIGSRDGGVHLLRTTDLLRDRFLRFKPLISISTHLETPPDPVTGVHFCYASDGSRVPTELWVVTSATLLSVSGATLRSEACCVLAEGGGAEKGCACVSDSGQIVLGRPEAIYLYGADERGPCFAFDGLKHALLWHSAPLPLPKGSGYT